MIQVIPAIDLKNGKCVRLMQGREASAVEYSADPPGVAEEWARQGAVRLHVVNLDGAFGRASGHLDMLRAIVKRSGVAVQYGGGLGTESDAAAAIDAGASRVVLGTVAIEQPQLLVVWLKRFGPEKVIVALDARKGHLATRGWAMQTGEPLLDVAARMRDLGVLEILYTDIERDGMMGGPDVATLSALSAKFPSILVSGGVSSADDIRQLKATGIRQITGVIVGKALYERKVDLRTLMAEGS